MGQPQFNGKRLGAAHGCHPRSPPGPENQPENDPLGHEIEPQAGKNFIYSPPGFQKTGDQRPEGATRHTGQHRRSEKKSDGTAFDAKTKQCRGKHRPHHDLTFNTDVPQTNSECK